MSVLPGHVLLHPKGGSLDKVLAQNDSPYHHEHGRESNGEDPKEITLLLESSLSSLKFVLLKLLQESVSVLSFFLSSVFSP